MSSRPFTVGIEVTGSGAHPASQRGATPDSIPGILRSRIPAAERYGFTYATIADTYSPAVATDPQAALADSVLQAAFSAPLTTAIGLVPVVNPVFKEPFNLAAQLSSLDHASHGRGGWVVSASGAASEAGAYERDPIDSPASVHAEAAAVVEAAKRLWDSWEDGAIIRDASTGRFLDGSRLHQIDYRAPSFFVRGPAIQPRPPQGQLVTFGYFSSLGTVPLDVVLLRGSDLEELRAGARDARGHGAVRVEVELELALDVAGRTAADRIAELDAEVPWSNSGRFRFLGSAPEAARLILGIASDVDGIRILPAEPDVDLHEIGRVILRELRDSGRFASPRAGGTLRQALGLVRPASIYAPSSQRPERLRVARHRFDVS